MVTFISEARRNWTREETTVALYLYFIIPFQKVSKSNPTIQEYAELLERTPSALGMKIGNIGRLDNTLKIKNISGLSNGSKLDEQVWNHYQGKWEQLYWDFEHIIAKLRKNSQKIPDSLDEQVYSFPEGKEKISQVAVRANQHFFRSSVLAAYNQKCCITGIEMPELLVASHIKPWKDDLDNRLNPRNGLCLNTLHDKAFDRGLITLDEQFRVVLSPLLLNTAETVKFFLPYENQEITLPERLSPDLELLDFHRRHIFKR
ncbi:HNH endonuclease [Mannheimia sp. E30BD]|uniref:HNH endonuclease n=1 Tax=Mannheimia sp. E30BD TaxID=3278708 RepID=UPI00359D85CF